MSDQGAALMAIAQRLYGAALTGDWATAGEIIHPDCMIVEATALPFAGTYVGLEGLKALFAKFAESIAVKDLKFLPMLTGPNLVCAQLEIIVEHNRQDVVLKVVEILRFEEGRVVELTPYYFDSALVHAIAKK